MLLVAAWFQDHFTRTDAFLTREPFFEVNHYERKRDMGMFRSKEDGDYLANRHDFIDYLVWSSLSALKGTMTGRPLRVWQEKFTRYGINMPLALLRQYGFDGPELNFDSDDY